MKIVLMSLALFLIICGNAFCGQIVSMPSSITVYNSGTNLVPTITTGIKMFVDTGVTDAAGEDTIYLTLDGTPTGTALFSQILSFSFGFGPLYNADATRCGVGMMRKIATDFKWVNIGLVRGVSLVGDGNTLQWSAGTGYRITIIGR